MFLLGALSAIAATTGGGLGFLWWDYKRTSKRPMTEEEKMFYETYLDRPKALEMDDWMYPY